MNLALEHLDADDRMHQNDHPGRVLAAHVLISFKISRIFDRSVVSAIIQGKNEMSTTPVQSSRTWLSPIQYAVSRLRVPFLFPNIIECHLAVDEWCPVPRRVCRLANEICDRRLP